MAIPVLNHMDFQKTAEIRNVKLHITASGDVLDPNAGMIIYDSGVIKYYNGTAWISLTTGAGITDEEVEDIVGVMVLGGTETLISVSYDDVNGKLDFVVNDDLSLYDNTTSGFLTAHPTIAAASSSDNSGRTYIQDILLDSNGHVTGITTATETVTNTDVDVSVANLRTRLGQISDDTTIGDASDVDITFAGGVVVTGDLTVNGTTTTVNSNEVSIGDAVILLNSDETGAPTQDAGIEIERGTSTNVTLVWDETNDKWTVGSQTFVAGTFEGSAALTGTPTAPSATATTDSTQIATTAFTQDAIDARTYVTSVGGATSIAVTHNLGTRDVIVQLYDNSTYDTVFADVQRNSTSQVTLGFATAPSAGSIRVLVSKIV